MISGKTVTFGNGITGIYPLASVTVDFDGVEYQVEAAVVEEDVLLRRDVLLHRHIVKRLPREEQMELLSWQRTTKLMKLY